MGVTVEKLWDDSCLPFHDQCFDRVINRHDSFLPSEVMRVLRPGGLFITQQVGGENNRDLSARLIDSFVPPYPEHNLRHNLSLLAKAGSSILYSSEAYAETRFFDIGALVYYARIIQWEFPGFSVDRCHQRLEDLHEELSRNGFISATEHRFCIVAQRP